MQKKAERWSRKYAHTGAYLAFRTALIRERGARCEQCGFIKPRLELHHKRPLFFCKSDTELEIETFRKSNIQILCRECHSEITIKDRTARRKANRNDPPEVKAWDALVEQRLEEYRNEEISRTAS